MKEYDVVCAVIIENDKVFCCRRGPGRALEGFWEFPGGKIEKGEMSHDALTREIKEELKSDIKIGHYIGIFQHEYDDFGIKMTAYECELESGNLELTEHTESKWLDVDELDSVQWADADKPIVDTVKDMLKKQHYILALSKENTSIDGWNSRYDEVKDLLDVVWEGICSEVEARRKFSNLIAKQCNEYHVLKTLPRWRVIRLYDATGKQIGQES